MKKVDVPAILVFHLLEEEQQDGEQAECSDFQQAVRKDGTKSLSALSDNGRKIGNLLRTENDQTAGYNDESDDSAGNFVIPLSLQLMLLFEFLAFLFGCGCQNQKNAVPDTEKQKSPLGAVPDANQDHIDAGSQVEAPFSPVAESHVQGRLDIIGNPTGKGHMPSAPVFAHILGKERTEKVLPDLESHDAADSTEGDIFCSYVTQSKDFCR